MKENLRVITLLQKKYLYNGIYPGRFDKFPGTLLSRQMTFSEGGLATPVNDTLGYSPWICSLTLSSSLPGKSSWIPIKPFATIVMNKGGNQPGSKPGLFFEAGLKAGLWNFLEVYFPFFVSDNINFTSGSVKERIRFDLKLDMFKSLRLR